jgi:hypothetical protein
MAIGLVTAAIVMLAILIAAAYLLPDTCGTEHRRGPSTGASDAPA